MKSHRPASSIAGALPGRGRPAASTTPRRRRPGGARRSLSGRISKHEASSIWVVPTTLTLACRSLGEVASSGLRRQVDDGIRRDLGQE